MGVGAVDFRISQFEYKIKFSFTGRQGDWPNLRAKTICTVVAGLMVATSCAGGVQAESLKDAAASAYKYNPRLAAERARQRATDEEVARANSGYRPTLSASGDIGFQRSETKPPAAGSDGAVNPKGYSVTARQPLFSGFRTINGVRVAEAVVRAGRETLRAVEQSVLLEAITSYMDVVRDRAIVKLRRTTFACWRKS
ncbi:MAG: TolC family protein [Hyphomicrobiaceae bacterium]